MLILDIKKKFFLKQNPTSQDGWRLVPVLDGVIPCIILTRLSFMIFFFLWFHALDEKKGFKPKMKKKN